MQETVLMLNPCQYVMGPWEHVITEQEQEYLRAYEDLFPVFQTDKFGHFPEIGKNEKP